MTVTEERKEKYDFATYRLDTLAFEAKKGAGISIKEPKDVAGKKIAVSSGTNQEALLVKWSEQNVAAGLAPTDISYYQNTTDYYLPLQSGRIDAYFGPNPSSQFHAKQSGGRPRLSVSSPGAGDTLQGGQIAVLVKKDNGLIKAINDAINHTIENGTYQQILERWNITSEAVDTSLINPPGLPKTK